MSRASLTQHYTRLLTSWPKDRLRNPKIAFQNLLEERSAATANLSDADAQKELLRINALYSLVENRYAKRYNLSEKVMQPASHPSYYLNLETQIEKAPETGWLQDKLNRWTGMFRLRG